MSVSLTVNGTTYIYPTNREAPGWGEEASAWSEAVTSVLENLVGPGDILTTSATIANNTAVASDVVGFSFDPVVVRAAICTYSVKRKTDTNEKVECGQIFASYNSTTASWDAPVFGGNSGGVVWTITSAGQVQYTSDNLTGTNYAGTIKFNAKSFTV